VLPEAPAPGTTTSAPASNTSLSTSESAAETLAASSQTLNETSAPSADPVSPTPGGADSAGPDATAQVDPVASPLDTTPPVADSQTVPADETGLASVPDTDDGEGIPTAAVFGLLALLGIGGAGIAAMRSRRRRAPVLRPAPTTVPGPNAEVAPVTGSTAAKPTTDTSTVVPVADPVSKPVSFERVHYPAIPDSDPKPLAATGASGSGDALVLDREMPARAHRPIAPRDLEGPLPVGEARQQLLSDMVAAEPDASNPFRSPKSRRRRARVILQHREHLQRQGSDQRFDWRTYRPTTKPSTPVKPSMVPA